MSEARTMSKTIIGVDTSPYRERLEQYKRLVKTSKISTKQLEKELPPIVISLQGIWILA